MLVLIDESGDCGLKFGKGSSDYFTCVAVVFSNAFSMDACDRTIDGLKMEMKEFYEFSVGIVCEHVKPLLNNAKIIIDRNGDRAFRQQLERRLKAQMTDKDGTCRIKKVVMETSHSNNLLQLADMVCGAVMRSYTASDPGFRDLVRRREKFVQLWPGW